jgi:P27 family predicted phage terminase small subunit
MAKTGPSPKPAELKLLEGNRGHRAIDLTSVFRPEVGLPTMPKHLSAEARKAWRRLTPELLRYNLVSTLDQDVLAMLCQTIGRVEQIERSIAARQALLVSQGKDPAEALIGLTPKGMEIQSVQYQVLNREMDKLRSLLAEFGLTPAQRAGVSPGVRVQQTLFDVKGAVIAPERDAQSGFADFE